MVGTSSTFITRVLIGCLPGSSGSTHTPLRPRCTRSPWVKCVARDVQVLVADVADHHADVADGDLGHRHLLDLHEPGVQVPRAGQQHLLLQAAAAAGVDERLAALEAVVPGDDGPARSPAGIGLAVEHGDDADPCRAATCVHERAAPASCRSERRCARCTTWNSAGLMR